jgi:hypothetical protein
MWGLLVKLFRSKSSGVDGSSSRPAARGYTVAGHTGQCHRSHGSAARADDHPARHHHLRDPDRRPGELQYRLLLGQGQRAHHRVLRALGVRLPGCQSGRHRRGLSPRCGCRPLDDLLAELRRHGRCVRLTIGHHVRLPDRVTHRHDVAGFGSSKAA